MSGSDELTAPVLTQRQTALLKVLGSEQMSTRRIAEACGINNRLTAAQRLRRMETAGLVAGEREGRDSVRWRATPVGKAALQAAQADLTPQSEENEPT